MVAATGRRQSALAGSTVVYFRDFLLFADHAAAEKAEKMAGHVERIKKWRQDYDQRRIARDDHQPQGRCAHVARAAR